MAFKLRAKPTAAESQDWYRWTCGDCGRSFTGPVGEECPYCEIKRLQAEIHKAGDHPLVMEQGGTSNADRCHRVINKQQGKIEQLQAILYKLRGGIADLQRHAQARSQDDPPRFIPAPMAAIIGNMHKVAEKGGKDE